LTKFKKKSPKKKFSPLVFFEILTGLPESHFFYLDQLWIFDGKCYY